MADLISREYALAVIENQMIMKEPEEGEPLIMEAYKSGFRDAMEQIRLDLMTVPVREKWIPMAVKEPEDGQMIIASLDPSELIEGSGIIIMTYDPSNEWMPVIKAWMPMPIPYIEPKKRRRKQK